MDKNASKTKKAILLLVCPDQPGIVSRVSDFLFREGGNIVDSDQHTDFETGIFFMRVEWEFERMNLTRKALENKVKVLAARFHMQYQLFFSDRPARMAIFVSQYGHCLYDLLVRHQLGEIQVDIPLVVSNHAELKPVADHFKIPFHVIPVTKENKAKAEAKQIQLMKKHRVDLVVLARYMQILSAHFVQAYPHRIINIHHSFLPAFIGGKPYHQAYARGVKVIGATAHYVTERLDEGPIIEQSVIRVSHRDRVEDLIRKGRDQEKVALASAVRMHLEHRILTYGNKTVVFE
ncbi:MAG: formyltetrahydrofolate deformylase [bacterium]